jgi:type II secretory pathway predicted ATPase ExeA
MNSLRHYFGFSTEPFAQDISLEHLYALPGIKGLTERFMYAVEMSGITVITGDVGTGKSTSLRYASHQLHPSAYKIVPAIANTGTYLEMLRQIATALQIDNKAGSLTRISKQIRNVVCEIAARKEKPVLIIDEAHLLRLEVFTQLHAINQFDFDSRPVMPLVLCGQNILIDKLAYHTSRSLASRILGRTHLEGLSKIDMTNYLQHHIAIAGVNEKLFSDEAVLAIHQGSGGLLRRANNLAKGAMIAAAKENCRVVSAEHVRIASTELF